MSKFKRSFIIIIRVLFVLFALFCLVWVLTDPNYNKWGGVFAGLGLPFLPPIVEKLFKIKVPFRIQLIYYIFLFAALSLGISLDLYKTVPYYDKVVHLGSGVVSTIVGYYAIVFFKAQKTPQLFRMLFIFALSVTIAVLWEYFEFFCDKCLGQSMQQLVTPGVDDTMFDLISASIGAIIGCFLFTSKKFVSELEKN